MGEEGGVPLYDLALAAAEIPNTINSYMGQIKFRTEGHWGKCCAGTNCVVARQKSKDTGFNPKVIEGPTFSDLEKNFWCGSCWTVGIEEHTKFTETQKKAARKGQKKLTEETLDWEGPVCFLKWWDRDWCNRYWPKGLDKDFWKSDKDRDDGSRSPGRGNWFSNPNKQESGGQGGTKGSSAKGRGKMGPKRLAISDEGGRKGTKDPNKGEGRSRGYSAEDRYWHQHPQYTGQQRKRDFREDNCRHFIKGKCRQGDSCRFRHPGSERSPRGGAPQYDQWGGPLPEEEETHEGHHWLPGFKEGMTHFWSWNRVIKEYEVGFINPQRAPDTIRLVDIDIATAEGHKQELPKLPNVDFRADDGRWLSIPRQVLNLARAARDMLYKDGEPPKGPPDDEEPSDEEAEEESAQRSNSSGDHKKRRYHRRGGSR